MISAPATKREVWSFLALLFSFSAVFYALFFLLPDGPKRWGAYTGAFMWCPGAAAVVTKLLVDKNLRGLGWGWGRARSSWRMRPVMI